LEDIYVILDRGDSEQRRYGTDNGNRITERRVAVAILQPSVNRKCGILDHTLPHGPPRPFYSKEEEKEENLQLFCGKSTFGNRETGEKCVRICGRRTCGEMRPKASHNKR
jgi:hypothetical protein